VKQQVPILVILGNPPYNAFAGTAPTKEEKDSVAPYKEGLIKKWRIKKFNLDDLYVRFFRMAERRIAEQTGRGVVCFISNYSWIEEPSFAVLRQHLLQSFDVFWIENLHGNRKISEYAPDGRTSETIFAIPGFSVGIQQGVATSLWVKKESKTAEPKIYFRDDVYAARAAERRKQLLDSLNAKEFDGQYQQACPSEKNRYSFRPLEVSADYLGWPRLTDICGDERYQGLSEDRRKALIDTDRESLSKRMQRYYDKKVSWDMLRIAGGPLIDSYVDFEAENIRSKVLSIESFDKSNIHRYSMRPFDVQYCYYTRARPVWRRHRPKFYHQVWKGNAFIVTRLKPSGSGEGIPVSYITGLCDYHYITPNAVIIPIRYAPPGVSSKVLNNQQQPLDIGVDPAPKANLSEAARSYLSSLGITNPDADAHTAGLIWMHALAVGYSPAYLSENADGIRKDWPRIPLPENKELLEASAELGEKIAALLDTEKPVSGVTAPPIRPEIQDIAVITREDGGQLQPKELAVTAGWGHAGQNGVVMPGKGKAVERDYTVEEKQSIVSGAEQLGIPPEKVLELLGEHTFDIYLNEVAYWKNVPARVWGYTIGGYHVIKKWLSYREADLLGRSLTSDEAREVMNMARRIAATILLQPALDENYQQCKGSSYSWARTDK
jgi:hypothetical protein